jgi:uncharacterized protein YukE
MAKQTYSFNVGPIPVDTGEVLTAGDIKAMFGTLDPGTVTQAADAHAKASARLQKIADNMVAHLQKMKDAWPQGQATSSAASSFNQLLTTATNLAQASAQTSAVLNKVSDVLQVYKNDGAAAIDATTGPTKGAQDLVAQSLFHQLNSTLAEANSSLPKSVTVDLPPAPKSSSMDLSTGSGGGAGIGTGALAAGGVAAGGAVGIGAGAALGSGSGSIGGAGSPGSSVTLASTPPGATGTGSTGALSGTGTGSGAGATTGSATGTGAGVLPGSSSTGTSSDGTGTTGAGIGTSDGQGVPGEGALGDGAGSVPGAEGLGAGDVAPAVGSDGMIGVLPGGSLTGGGTGVGGAGSDLGGAGAGEGASAGAAGAADGTTADAASSNGFYGMPMMGGAGAAGQSERDRQRQSWLTEDSDVWDPGTPVVPHMIGQRDR